MAEVLTFRTPQHVGHQALRQTATAGLRADEDLPDKKCLWLIGRHVAGHPADHLALHFRHRTGGGEMAALQKVAVEGVVVEGFGIADQSPDGCTVACTGRAYGDRRPRRSLRPCFRLLHRSSPFAVANYLAYAN